MSGVLERLEPPEYLKELTISRYSGDQFPSWMHDSSSVLSNLVYMKLYVCVNCTQLPTLGKLGSLERLHLNQLNSVKCVGPEFFGANGDVVLFPKLEELSIANMKELEQWKIPHFSQEDTSRIKIMPSLCELIITDCPKLRVLPDMSKFNSLETLRLFRLPKWEGEEEGEERKEFIRLKLLSISGCGKLKVIPHSMFSRTLRELWIDDCPGLRGNQPYLPPLLESLSLRGDVGVFSESLPLNKQFASSINFFLLSGSPHSSPPKGFNQFKLLQTLIFRECISLSFDPKDLQQFTMLKDLHISRCPLLEFRFRRWKKLESPVDYDFDVIQLRASLSIGSKFDVHGNSN